MDPMTEDEIVAVIAWADKYDVNNQGLNSLIDLIERISDRAFNDGVDYNLEP